jgi:hypothetical protein
MLLPLLLSWTLLVQVQLDVCDTTGCKPHPTLKETQRTVATVRSEAECLTLQIQTQQKLNEARNRRPPVSKGQRHVEARATLACVPAKES